MIFFISTEPISFLKYIYHGTFLVILLNALNIKKLVITRIILKDCIIILNLKF